MRYKNGQVAFEFLMTYGLAILVVLICIGALAYFGMLNPERFKPKNETVEIEEINCKELFEDCQIWENNCIERFDDEHDVK